MDPATSKQCMNCSQEVFPREIGSDGVCKSCKRKQYYQSRKELLAERYKQNREHRLQKQREYYLKKKESRDGAPSKPSTSRRRSSTNSQQHQTPAPYVQTTEYNDKPENGQTPALPQNVIIEQGTSSINPLSVGLDLLNGPATLVKMPYPFTTTTNGPVTVSTQQFMTPYITWEMLNQSQQQNGIGRL